MPPIAASFAPQLRSRRRLPHVIEDVQFTRPLFLLCTCGHLITGASSIEEQGIAFQQHRLSLGARRHV